MAIRIQLVAGDASGYANPVVNSFGNKYGVEMMNLSLASRNQLCLKVMKLACGCLLTFQVACHRDISQVKNSEDVASDKKQTYSWMVAASYSLSESDVNSQLELGLDGRGHFYSSDGRLLSNDALDDLVVMLSNHKAARTATLVVEPADASDPPISADVLLTALATVNERAAQLGKSKDFNLVVRLPLVKTR
jgi:hypothetical protein